MPSGRRSRPANALFQGPPEDVGEGLGHDSPSKVTCALATHLQVHTETTGAAPSSRGARRAELSIAGREHKRFNFHTAKHAAFGILPGTFGLENVRIPAVLEQTETLLSSPCRCFQIIAQSVVSSLNFQECDSGCAARRTITGLFV